jgi:hypothetical protein
MHQTTVRFGGDLWNALVEEADRSGVSVAQYVREAAVARLARSEAQAEARGARGWSSPDDGHREPPGEYESNAELSAAVRSQSALAVDRSRRIRRNSEAARSHAKSE